MSPIWEGKYELLVVMNLEERFSNNWDVSVDTNTHVLPVNPDPTDSEIGGKD